MNISLIFTSLSLLSFEIKFQFDNVDHQDLFIFSGDNTSAHLFRSNDSVILYLRNSKSFEIYESTHLSPITFEWKDYMINGEQMVLSRSQGSIIKDNYQDFVFISPIFEFDENGSIAEPILNFKFEDLNYGYLLIIVFGVGIALHPNLIGYVGPEISRLFSKSVQNETIELEQI